MAESNMVIENISSPLSKAFAKAQGEFKVPTLNREAQIKKDGKLLYSTYYADIEECISCIKESLSKNELSFTQVIDKLGNEWVLKLILLHSGGERIESILPLNVNQTPQQLGGLLTYFKRYQISAFFGLAADYDDDGNEAEGKGNIYNPNPNKPNNNIQTKAAPKIDSGNYVVTFGNDTKGKMIKDLSENTLRNMNKYVNEELAKTPPPPNLADLFKFQTELKKFFKEMDLNL